MLGQVFSLMIIRSDACRILGLHCVGCCGKNFSSKEEVTSSIEKNTLEFASCTSLEAFRDRALPHELRMSGACRNIIFREGLPICPLHPAVAGGEKDLRYGHCDPDHLCKSAFLYNVWEEEKREAFVEMLRNKDLDWYSFSVGMDSGEFVGEFLRGYRR